MNDNSCSSGVNTRGAQDNGAHRQPERYQFTIPRYLFFTNCCRLLSYLGPTPNPSQPTHTFNHFTTTSQPTPCIPTRPTPHFAYARTHIEYTVHLSRLPELNAVKHTTSELNSDRPPVPSPSPQHSVTPCG